MSLHRLPSELGQQGRLAPARPAGDKDHPAVTSQRLGQVGVQERQLALPGDKHRWLSLVGILLQKAGEPGDRFRLANQDGRPN